MSLIPNESLSFPDDFSRAITRARALNEAKATAALLNARAKRPKSRVVVAEPEPVIEAPKPKLPPVDRAPAVIPAPKPAVPKQKPVKALEYKREPTPQNDSAPQLPAIKPAPRIQRALVKLRPKPRQHELTENQTGSPASSNENKSIQRPPPPAPLRVLPVAPAAVRIPPAPAPINARPKPAPIGVPPAAPKTPEKKPAAQLPIVSAPSLPPEKVRSNPAAPTVPQPKNSRPVAPAPVMPVAFDDFGFETEPKAQARFHRSRKWTRFILSESIVIAILISSAVIALSHYFTDPVMIFILNAVTIAAAVLAGLVPILFFAITPTLPRIER